MIEEDKKNQDRVHDLVEKLHAKLKIYKRQLEESEQVASCNLAKFKQLQQACDDAHERADSAENALAKMRARSRGVSAGPHGVAHS
uniref:Myosin heavy chain n=1 Tax=Romanomermis culicivorax TaxID=13658 RepID=A0A915J4C1_ROMCU